MHRNNLIFYNTINSFTPRSCKTCQFDNIQRNSFVAENLFNEMFFASYVIHILSHLLTKIPGKIIFIGLVKLTKFNVRFESMQFLRWLLLICNIETISGLWFFLLKKYVNDPYLQLYFCMHNSMHNACTYVS